MFRGNEMMAAFALAQLEKLPARTAAAQANAKRLAAALDEVPGARAQRIPDDRESVHHKFRVHLDPAALGLDLAPRDFRDVVRKALTAEGANAVLWQDHTLPEHPLFKGLEGFGHGWPQPGTVATTKLMPTVSSSPRSKCSCAVSSRPWRA